MSTSIENAIVEQLHALDEKHQAEVLDFVQFLIAKSRGASSAKDWPSMDPARDFSRFIGTDPITEDGVAFQRHIRDTEWP